MKMDRPQRLLKPNGFTLLELLAVLAITAGLLLLVTPNIYRSIPGVQLSSAVAQLASDLRQVRAFAIQSARPTSLVLDVDHRSYTMSGRADSMLIEKHIDLTLLTGSSLLKDTRRGAIYFYPDGSSTGGVVTLQRGERQQQIRINWLTGDIRIQNDV